MMRFWMTFAVALMVTVSLAQLAKPIQFREEIYDFGMVEEQQGSVLHEFVFTNNSRRPIKILGVQASCGCTTPSWTKDIIPAGKAGFVQASFNPKGRPGYFNKSLTVTTDFDATPIILQIKGQVRVSGDLASSSDFQAANGSWKFKTGAFNLGKVYIKDEYTSRDFPVLNAGTSAVTYTGKFIGPSYIQVDVSPKTLQPGEKGHVKVSYNGKMKGKYGFQSDNVELLTDDVDNPTKSFSVYATLEDDFRNLTAEDYARAPQLRLQATSIDLGRVRQNGTAVKVIEFYNTGKKELDLRAVQGNCSCITASASKMSLQPGESSSLKIEFSPMDRKGSQQKAVTVYSNDPQNPVQRVTFTAYIED